MLLIDTYLASSNIHGIGLFAGQNIKKGTVTWRFHEALDIVFTPSELAALPERVVAYVHEYGSLSKLSGKWVVSADNTRFTNHSSQPNLDTIRLEGEPETVAVANKDIVKGEELTIDYKTFDQVSERSSKDYLQE